jgi:hypothetical protein
MPTKNKKREYLGQEERRAKSRHLPRTGLALMLGNCSDETREEVSTHNRVDRIKANGFFNSMFI